MSKNIWHTADEAPKYCFLCAFYDQTQGLSVGHYNPVKKQFCSGDRRFNHDEIKTYCDIHDLLALETDLDRTRKALDVAVDALDTVRQYYRGTAVIRPHNIAAYCDNKIDKIKEITALEQKDVK